MYNLLVITEKTNIEYLNYFNKLNNVKIYAYDFLHQPRQKSILNVQFLKDTNKNDLINYEIDILIVNINWVKQSSTQYIKDLILSYNISKQVDIFTTIPILIDNACVNIYNTVKVDTIIKKYKLENSHFNEHSNISKSIKNSKQNYCKTNNKMNKPEINDFFLNKFAKICLDNLENFKNIKLNDVLEISEKNAVYIEFRKLTHSEVLIRNVIYKLGEDWCHTIITGSESYDYYNELCKQINKNIKVIKLNVSNFTHNDYNNLLLTKNFWNMLDGEKILIYQSDTFIFNDNINDFLEWDYIGAPYRTNASVLNANHQVGNGGLSLRSKSKMIEVLDKVNLLENIYSIQVNQYKINKMLDKYPEDIVFSQNLQNLNIGKVADYETALRFASDSVYNENSFGMHSMWNGCRNWETKISNCLCKKINISNYKTDVIIYILCYNETRYNDAFNIYKKYNWAIPILMKYNDYSFENSFWKQLSETEEEWINYEMVGTLSYSAFKKIDLDCVNNIIVKKLYRPNNYYHFFNLNLKIPSVNTNNHPDFYNIWCRILPQLNLYSSNEAIGNYWICSPNIMKQFINWYIRVAKPLLLNDEDIFKNSNYKSSNFNIDLVKLWGKNYFPNYPFICERLIHTYFVCNYKILFLISHEKSQTGAPLILEELKDSYTNKNIKVVLLYYDELINKNVNIVNYINETCKEFQMSPVVIVNTVVPYKLIRQLMTTNILTYWYIHEWVDDSFYNFSFKSEILETMNEIYKFRNIKLLFISESQMNLYKSLNVNISEKNKFIMYNKLSKEKLDIKTQENISSEYDNLFKNLTISMIGTVDNRKNQQSFIDNVFYNLVDKFNNVTLMLIGNVLYEPQINHKYKENIKIIGQVNNPIPFIHKSDIIVSYSLNEVFPLNIMEAFYCKKPVVSTNVGSVHEMIHDCENGFLINPNEHNRCYEILCNLILNKELRYKIGESAYNKYNKCYNEDLSDDKMYLIGFN